MGAATRRERYHAAPPAPRPGDSMGDGPADADLTAVPHAFPSSTSRPFAFDDHGLPVSLPRLIRPAAGVTRSSRLRFRWDRSAGGGPT
jgi:hypothetical protein